MLLCRVEFETADNVWIEFVLLRLFDSAGGVQFLRRDPAEPLLRQCFN